MTRSEFSKPGRALLLSWVLLASALFPALAQAQPALAAASAAPASAAPSGAPENPFVVPRHEGSAFVDEKDPEHSTPSGAERQEDPLKFGYYLMELGGKVASAFEHKDYEGAVKFSRALAKSVPERAVGWSKMCEAYQVLGKFREAEAACNEALARPDATISDAARFVEVYLAGRPGDLTSQEIQRLDAVLDNLRKSPEPEAQVLAAQTACRVGAKLEDAVRLRPCVALLNERLPHDLLTISYSWALAIADRDAAGAERERQRAQAAGLAPQALEQMRVGGERILHRKMKVLWLWAGAAAIAVLTLFLYVYNARRKRSEMHA